MENSLHQVVAVAFSVAPPFADSVQLVGYSLVVKDVKILVDTSERVFWFYSYFTNVRFFSFFKVGIENLCFWWMRMQLFLKML
jgi:hypothetical protein